MNENGKVQEVATQMPTNLEEHGIDLSLASELITAGASVVTAGAAVYGASHSGEPSQAPPPDPPELELPAGVDRE